MLFIDVLYLWYMLLTGYLWELLVNGMCWCYWLTIGDIGDYLWMLFIDVTFWCYLLLLIVSVIITIYCFYVLWINLIPCVTQGISRW